MKCIYCGSEIISSVRCKDCGAWLRFWSFLVYPETIYKSIGLLIAIASAVIAWQQANEARKEKKATADLKAEVVSVAENLTKMAFVLADGTGRWDGIPPQHMEKIKEYKAKLEKQLPATIDKEISSTLKDLNKSIKR
jgi:hypothetical protein